MSRAPRPETMRLRRVSAAALGLLQLAAGCAREAPATPFAGPVGYELVVRLAPGAQLDRSVLYARMRDAVQDIYSDRRSSAATSSTRERTPSFR
jgi:hypothetical protein